MIRNAYMLCQFWFAIKLLRLAIYLNLKGQPPDWARHDAELRRMLLFMKLGRDLIHCSIAIDRWNKARQAAGG